MKAQQYNTHIHTQTHLLSARYTKLGSVSFIHIHLYWLTLSSMENLFAQFVRFHFPLEKRRFIFFVVSFCCCCCFIVIVFLLSLSLALSLTLCVIECFKRLPTNLITVDVLPLVALHASVLSTIICVKYVRLKYAHAHQLRLNTPTITLWIQWRTMRTISSGATKIQAFVLLWIYNEWYIKTYIQCKHNCSGIFLVSYSWCVVISRSKLLA